MKLIFSVIFVFLINSLYSQIKAMDSVMLNQGEGIIVKLKLNKNVSTAKSICTNSSEMLDLWQITIIDLYHMPSNQLFDSSTIYNLKYIVCLQNYSDTLNSDKEFIVSLLPTISNKYLKLNRVFYASMVDKKTIFYYKGQGMYFSNKFYCYKKRFWLIRFLYSKKNRMIPIKDPFENFFSNDG